MEGHEPFLVPVLSGLPLGRVSRPNIFLVIGKDLKFSTIVFFADDSVLYGPVEKQSEAHCF